MAEYHGGGGKPFFAGVYPLLSFNLSHFLGCRARITQIFAGCMGLRELSIHLGVTPVTDEMRNYFIVLN